MKLATILPALMACSHAMLIPNRDNEGALQKRADSVFDSEASEATDIANSKVSLAVEPRESVAATSDETVVPLQYIVVFKAGEDEAAYEAHDEWVVAQFSALKKRGDLPDNVSDQVEFFNVLNFKGYTGYLPPTLLDTIKEDPLVDFVEENQIFHTNALATQNGAPWGIARVSQRTNTKSTQYKYDDQAGKGVTAFVVDTGIKVEHPDFEGRATWGLAIPAPYTKADGDGHGTHVAGTIGGKTYGVAKKVDLVAVAVFDASGEGTTSDVIKGIEFAVKAHQAKVSAKTKGYKGATMNLSLGGPASTAMDRAVNAAVNAGVHVVVAAGNENQNACNVSPARATGPITVGATDINDKRASYSNYGTCVNVQAPGSSILSAGINLLTDTLSGTSMATPHVVGVLSSFLSLQPGIGSEFSADQLIKPADMKRKFIGFGTKNVVTGLDSASPNVLAYNGAGQSLADLWSL